MCLEMLQLCSSANMLLPSFPGVVEIPFMGPFVLFIVSKGNLYNAVKDS